MNIVVFAAFIALPPFPLLPRHISAGDLREADAGAPGQRGVHEAGTGKSKTVAVARCMALVCFCLGKRRRFRCVGRGAGCEIDTAIRGFYSCASHCCPANEVCPLRYFEDCDNISNRSAPVILFARPSAQRETRVNTHTSVRTAPPSSCPHSVSRTVTCWTSFIWPRLVLLGSMTSFIIRDLRYQRNSWGRSPR